VCIPVEVRSAGFNQKLIFRCPMPHKLAEATYPGTINVLCSSRQSGCLGAYVYLNKAIHPDYCLILAFLQRCPPCPWFVQISVPWQSLGREAQCFQGTYKEMLCNLSVKEILSGIPLSARYCQQEKLS
jgi:hypothetical protein